MKTNIKSNGRLFKPLPEDNLREARRIEKSLKNYMIEMNQKIDDMKINAIKKKLGI